MSFDSKFAPQQKGRVAIVTGANTGLGYEAALGLSKTGMTVILACRDLKKARLAMSRLKRESINADVDIMKIDLSSLASVRNFVEEFLSKYERLDLLINNAGIMMPPYSVSEDGLESQMAANYFGHFLLTGLLLGILEKTPNSRTIMLASLAHKSGKINFKDLQSAKKYNRWGAYAQSKLACLMYSYELQRRLSAKNMQTIAIAAHPGVSASDLSRNLPDFVNSLIAPLVLRVGGQTAKQGALSILYAALNPNLRGGEYIGPKNRLGWKGKPAKIRAKKHAYDKIVAERLWLESEKLTGICYLA